MPTRLFSCEYCEIFKSNIFYGTRAVAAFVLFILMHCHDTLQLTDSNCWGEKDLTWFFIFIFYLRLSSILILFYLLLWLESFDKVTIRWKLAWGWWESIQEGGAGLGGFYFLSFIVFWFCIRETRTFVSCRG